MNLLKNTGQTKEPFMKYQFNKTAIQNLQKELKIRQEALPTLKSKETALRNELKIAKQEYEQKNKELEDLIQQESKNYKVWMEYPSVLSIKDIKVENKNIAGVKVPSLTHIEFFIRDHSLYAQRAWVPKGTEILKKLAKLKIELQLQKKTIEILTFARKKTTQKVNLYEKVQIPEFTAAIQKIKRFLEDEENLIKASQKIIKTKKETSSNGVYP